MSLVKLTIKGISYSQTQNGAYALILNEVDGDRKLPIVIGAFEAQSIAIALEKEINQKGGRAVSFFVSCVLSRGVVYLLKGDSRKSCFTLHNMSSMREPGNSP